MGANVKITAQNRFGIAFFPGESETTIKINRGQGAERKIVQNAIFHGKRHDNKYLKVKLLLLSYFVVMAQAPIFVRCNCCTDLLEVMWALRPFVAGESCLGARLLCVPFIPSPFGLTETKVEGMLVHRQAGEVAKHYKSCCFQHLACQERTWETKGQFSVFS